MKFPIALLSLLTTAAYAQHEPKGLRGSTEDLEFLEDHDEVISLPSGSEATIRCAHSSQNCCIRNGSTTCSITDIRGDIINIGSRIVCLSSGSVYSSGDNCNLTCNGSCGPVVEAGVSPPARSIPTSGGEGGSCGFGAGCATINLEPQSEDRAASCQGNPFCEMIGGECCAKNHNGGGGEGFGGRGWPFSSGGKAADCSSIPFFACENNPNCVRGGPLNMQCISRSGSGGSGGSGGKFCIC